MPKNFKKLGKPEWQLKNEVLSEKQQGQDNYQISDLKKEIKASLNTFSRPKVIEM